MKIRIIDHKIKVLGDDIDSKCSLTSIELEDHELVKLTLFWGARIIEIAKISKNAILEKKWDNFCEEVKKKWEVDKKELHENIRELYKHLSISAEIEFTQHWLKQIKYFCDMLMCKTYRRKDLLLFWTLDNIECCLIYKRYTNKRGERIFDQLIEQGYSLLFNINKDDMFEYSMKIRETLREVYGIPQLLGYHLKRINDRSTIEIQLSQ